MAEIVYDIETFFAQLGLPEDGKSIDHFLNTHYLPIGTPIYKAFFWTRAQAALFHESLTEDAAWAIVADQIANLLSKPCCTKAL